MVPRAQVRVNAIPSSAHSLSQRVCTTVKSVRERRILWARFGRVRAEGIHGDHLEGIFLGLVAMAIGLAFAFYGLRLFLILLPIWGFVMGFCFGARPGHRTVRPGLPGDDHQLGVGFVVGA